MSTIYCSKCGNQQNADAKFCSKCGSPVESVDNTEANSATITCYECGQTIPADVESCPNCGAPMSNRVICYECGQSIPNNAKSCPNCGAPMVQKRAAKETSQAFPPTPQPQPKEVTQQPMPKQEAKIFLTSNSAQKKKGSALHWVLLAVVAIVATVVILMLLPGKEDNTEPAAKENVIENKTEITIKANGVAIPMKLIAGGTFTMGGSLEGIDYKNNELPAHSMKVESFYMSEYEVTQQLWTAIMGTNPSEFIGEQNPVENVNWYDCVEFTKKLCSLTGKTFRLPTEAEWEYAAKGGANQENYEFAGSNHIGDVAWAASNSGKTTHPVGQKSCNRCGLYDMSGNVYEWCSSWYAPYTVETMNNPLGPDSGEDKVFRGGSWKYSDTYCRVTYRPHTNPNGKYNNLGLRLVLEIPHK